MSEKDPPTIDSPVSDLKMVSVHGSFPFDDSGQFLVNFRMFLKNAQKGVTRPCLPYYYVFGGLRVSYMSYSVYF